MKIGLAFGGGGARGLGHLPVIGALEDLGLKPNAIAGSSIGSIVGAGVASGMTETDWKEYCLSTFSNSNDILKRLWSLMPTSWKEFWECSLHLFQFNLELILENFLPLNFPRDFCALEIPFCAVASNLKTAEMVVIQEGDLRSALAASSAIPGLFKPVLRNHDFLIDGAVSNPVPFDCFTEPIDLSIGVDVTGLPIIGCKNGNLSVSESLIAAGIVGQRALVRTRLQCAKLDLLLCPPVDGIQILNFFEVKEILQRVGPFREKAKRQISELVERKIVH
ncbi:putative Patatin [Bartonella clarridgeiae 73]|uniref:Putative Patatin n=1 Tax=Bartonella clarridgeiae (strain CCUG 45776 / CIP 104772 / 73) TaxID=696125 RepID=E6YG97_BARC7|nr:patatin-like phospholipase family protein [Bartonella clarridgeiae]WCR55507.1 MAG: Serine protease [Bartonella clarridgeiae]CBI75885.1 putative Patatin [Bartonella clarridgeiae 73]